MNKTSSSLQILTMLSTMTGATTSEGRMVLTTMRSNPTNQREVRESEVTNSADAAREARLEAEELAKIEQMVSSISYERALSLAKRSPPPHEWPD